MTFDPHITPADTTTLLSTSLQIRCLGPDHMTTPWGYRHGDRLQQATREVSCSWRLDVWLWFLLLINHMGFHWAGWKFPALFCGDTNRKLYYAVRLDLFARPATFKPVSTTHTPINIFFIYHCYISERPRRHRSDGMRHDVSFSIFPKWTLETNTSKKRDSRRERKGNHLFLSRHKRGAGGIVGYNGGQEARQAGQTS